jgi:metal-responsive CopG/Arc/MetJ family transcriptional regulator
MAGEKIELMMPAELADELGRIATALGIANREEAALIAIGEWLAQHRDRIEAADPAEKYFVNEALDELAAKLRK